MRILLVEDEPAAAAMLAKGLREQTYAVDIAGDGQTALDQAAANDYDLVILDLLLPGRSGLAVCREIREAGSTTPILMLTALDAVAQRVAGLDAGADDYVPKPYHPPELFARIRALLRRGPALEHATISIADLTIDTRTRAVTRAGQPIRLTSREYALLEYLAHRPDHAATRADIAEHVWDETFDAASNLIDVYVQRLRRKIDDGHRLKLLRTRRGLGYLISGSPEDA